MSFTIEIKNELIKNKYNIKEKKWFLKGILFSSLKVESKEFKIFLKNKEFFYFLINLLNNNQISFVQNEKWVLIKNDFLIDDLIPNEKFITYFIAGCFFANGSISKLNSSSYHLQIKFKNFDNAKRFISLVDKHLKFNLVQHRNEFVVYIKKHELISDFLNIIYVQKAYFKFIDYVIQRDYLNQINRISNLDIYNQAKIVDSHEIFLEEYNFILDNKLQKFFSENELFFYEFKKQNPYLSLNELCLKFNKKYNLQKTKSGLNHWMIKLRKIYDKESNFLEWKRKKM